MKKKGFTLIELLAVIVILGVIGLIIVPVVNRVVEDAREKSYILQINNIKEAAKAWAAENVGQLPDEENEVITITLGQLKMAGLIDSGIKDPKTDEMFPNDMEITIKLYMNNYIYEVLTGTGTSTGNYDPTLPIITLIGETNEKVQINSTYVEKGVIAKDPTGSIMNNVNITIKSNLATVEQVDTSRFGQYTITYSVTYSDKTTTIARTVTVVDTIPPILTIPANITLKENEVASFNLLEGVSATDNNNDEVIITKEGNLTARKGTYYITYIATDSKGNQTRKTRQIIVETTSVISGFDEAKGVNKPVLVTGMTPIKWGLNNNEIETNENDIEWYDYSAKKWANAKTADGSYWVWIPRYAYKIASGYHSSTPGAMEIKFLKERTNETVDGTTVETNGYDVTNKNTSQHYFKHPAFKFGEEETLGFWVAKFEPSVSNQADLCYTSASVANCNKTDLVPKIVPNASSWRYTTIGSQFEIALNMKNNSVYGWNANKVDTHMMKNDEWGAVAYLSKSIYGIDKGEVYMNNSSTYTTGCAGNTVLEASFNGCQNAYNTANGVKASTTHNIYGIYDMSGGSWEYVSAYIENNHENLTIYGQSILNAEPKYKNIYEVGSTDTMPNNYEKNNNIYGDAVYETSSAGESSTSWYGDYSVMPNTSYPWFPRGGYYSNTTAAGVFGFFRGSGNAHGNHSFRLVLSPLEQ